MILTLLSNVVLSCFGKNWLYNRSLIKNTDVKKSAFQSILRNFGEQLITYQEEFCNKIFL